MFKQALILLTFFFAISAHAQASFEISFTVDDLPQGFGTFNGLSRLESARAMIVAFKKHGITNVYGFVNSAQNGNDPESIEILKLWIEAGFKLGNHTATHTGALQMTANEFIKDIEATDQFLAKLGVDIHTRRMFRYPYLAEGNTLYKRKKIRDYLLKNGYQIAPVTVDVFDYRAQARLDKAKTPQERSKALAYGIQLSMENLKSGIELSAQSYGRQIRHVALMHLLEMHAVTLDEVLTRWTQAGAEYVTLNRALQDPAYAYDLGQAATGMGNHFDELRYASGEWDLDGDRRARFRPSTIQRYVNHARAFAPTCEDLFAVLMGP